MITKDTSVREILDTSEALSAILLSFGLDCEGCPGASSESLEEAAKGHNVDLEALLNVLNDRSNS